MTNDCCTACGVPKAKAPDHFTYDTDGHCYVTRQPETPDQIQSMLEVIRGQELGCVRYRGTDAQILRRLVEAGEGDQCDAPLPRGVVPVLRNHVSFAATDPAARTWRGIHVLEDFADHLRCYPNEHRMTPIVQDGDDAYFSVCWFEDDFHRIVIRSTGRAPGHWFVRHSFSLGLSETIDYWLKASSRFADVRWYTEAEWDAMRPGQDRPW